MFHEDVYGITLGDYPKTNLCLLIAEIWIGSLLYPSALRHRSTTKHPPSSFIIIIINNNNNGISSIVVVVNKK